PRPPTAPLSPYTTLFRSLELALVPRQQPVDRVLALQRAGLGIDHLAVAKVDRGLTIRRPGELDDTRLAADLDRLDHVHDRHVGRSEEHTSELQSRENLVC